MTIGAVDVAPTSGDGTTGIDPHALIKLHPEYAASLPRASGGDNRRSEYARDVLGKVPHWTQRWGLGVLLAFFVLLVLLAWVVRYPDVLVGRGVLLSPNPPAPILARTSGRIATLVVTDRQSVEAGERLAVIESVSDIDEMDRLSHWLDRLTDTPAVAELAGIPSFRRLGDAQQDYLSLVERIDDLAFLHELAPARREADAIRAEMHDTRQLLEAHHRQKATLDEEMTLTDQSRNRLLSMTQEGLVAPEAVTQSSRDVVRARFNSQAADADIAGTRVELSRLQRQLTQLELEFRQRSHEQRAALLDALHALEDSVDRWQNTHVLTTPIAGHVSLHNIRAAHQSVRAGDEVMIVLPAARTDVFAVVDIPARAAGKVREGNPVVLRLDQYPFEEFGVLDAVVTGIAPLPRENAYRITVEIPRQLVTSTGLELMPSASMPADARVITEELRLLERIYYRLIRAVGSDGATHL